MTAPIPRDLDVDFSKVPRHWLYGNATATAIANGVNLLFPWGERFFVRSVNHYLDRIDDAELRAQIKGFFGQEGRHAHAHDRFNQILREQGYEIDTFLAGYKKWSQWIEDRTSPETHLAVTAACEHFTAIMANGAFTRGVLDEAAPEMKLLLAWHAAEEIEHKSVAFDVLKKVDPRYRTRMKGLVLATLTLGGFWIWAAAHLLRQDRVKGRSILRELNEQRKQDPMIRRVFVRGIRQYLRRDFHPNDHDDRNLAAEWFAARGMSMPEPKTSAA